MGYNFPQTYPGGPAWNEPEEKKYWNINDYPDLKAIFDKYVNTDEWYTFYDWADANGLIKGGDDQSWMAQALPAYEEYKKAGSAEAQDKALEDAKTAQEEAEKQKAVEEETSVYNNDWTEWMQQYPDEWEEFTKSAEWDSVKNGSASDQAGISAAIQKWKDRAASEAKAAEEEANKTTTETENVISENETATQTETTAGDVEGDNYGNRTQQAEIQQAMSDSADAAQQEAYNNYVQNATSGINRSRAGLLADQGTDTTQNVQSNYNANRQLGTSTQNDYLQKMQQAKSYEQQARNMKAGSFLNTMSGLLQGAGAGAALGATI